MNKTEIKNAPSNDLIINLVDTYACIVAKNGWHCKGLGIELNNTANELKDRGLLTDVDINHLNS